MEKKYGCYICTGCGLGDALDMAALEVVARKEQKFPVVRQHPLLCSPEGHALIEKDMADEGVNTLCIAACSPRVMAEHFRFNTPLIDRVNLREQVLWSLDVPEGDDTARENRQMMAEDYLRMGAIKLKKMNPPAPFEDPGMSKRILVVGGGVSGLTAASEAAALGYEVILVEKAATLGGRVASMHKVSPVKPPYAQLEDSGIAELIAKVESHRGIKIYKEARILETRGAPGLFDSDISVGGQTTTERYGAIVVATGFNLYDAGKLTHLGHGTSPDVITSWDFEQMAKAGKILRPSDGKPARRVAFVLCAGSRDKNHLEYCSGACCTYSMKQALYVKEQYPDASTYLIYQEIRTPGQMEDFYRKVQNEGGVFIKGDVQDVKATPGGGVRVAVNDKLLRGPETLDVDLLVLATGMTPNLDTTNPNVLTDMNRSDEDKARSVLNLLYRQGPSLPELKWGFPDSHYICFPYETRRTGIYAAGPARRPMGVSASRTDATGAVLKAIQAVEAVARGAAVHPRVGDLSYPSFRVEACTQCKRCTEECPFGAINEDAKGNPQFNPTRCRRCGTCMGACPQKIISFANYSVDMIGSMLKGCEVPPEEDEKPRILILACQNDAYPALDAVGSNGGRISPYVRVVPLRCLGSANLVWIADSLSSGYDGVMLMGCRHGDDYQCHFVKGSQLAEIRLSKVSETLTRLKLESDRVRMVEVNIMDADRLPGVISDFAERLAELGPNPFKGF
ncbi:MAG: FAD-dependent oxidoreductase [Magnetococcus sp. WYHC-3]